MKNLSVRGVENQIRKYIDDAAALARGVRFDATNCYLDGLATPAELSAAIKELGEEYLRKLSALAKAAPVVRGDTISIFEPKPAPAANAPSLEDERFLIACRKQYLRDGYILASDSDTYEAIAKKYPNHVFPSRLRGAQGKRWRALHEPDAVTGRIKPGRLLRGKTK